MPKIQVQVDDFDHANLRASGLTDATIAANKLRTENGALVFPYRDLNGEVNGFARTRPHKPRVVDGKVAKYLQPKGSPLKAYYPAKSIKALRGGDAPIFVTEGEKKALALSQLGLAAIGLGGVYNWKRKDTEELIDDLLDIYWAGRDVYIVFDYDAKPDTRVQVENARRRLANALRVAGAEVYAIDLPPGANLEKQGIDDFLVASGPAAFQELVERAQPISVIKIIVPALSAAAYHGLAGDFIRGVSDYTEATDAAILAHLLPAIGTLIGPGPRVYAGAPQPARIFSAVVGPTNCGRKGTAAYPVEELMLGVDDGFWNGQRSSGLSSGEGLIQKVADIRTKNEEGEWEVVPVEKRLYVIEPEFSRVLANIRREGNILSQIMREAYDTGILSTLTVNPRLAVGAHISIVAHVTPEELANRLQQVEMANGFGNRFLWWYVSSDKLLPHTEPIPLSFYTPFRERLLELLNLGTECNGANVKMDSAAARVWESIYYRLRDDRPGLVGAMIARGSTMILRLALLYCLIDRWGRGKGKIQISTDHLEAAQAVWRYCEDSARQLFGGKGGDTLSDKLLRIVLGGPVSRTELNRHLSPKQKEVADETLAKMEKAGLIRSKYVKQLGAGRPKLVFEAVPVKGAKQLF